MTTLSSSPVFPVSPEIKTQHADGIAAFGAPGTWLDAQTRINILIEARHASQCSLCESRKNALSPYATKGEHETVTELPLPLVEIVHRIRTDSGRLTKAWFEQQMAGGTKPEAYVEAVGLTATSIIIDSFADAIGDTRAAPPSAAAGMPTETVNENVFDGGAWVPMLDIPQEATDVGLPSSPNIFRAMGLVPKAIEHFFSVMRAHYSLSMMSFSLSRPQTELIASRVSALNQCYY